MFWPANRSAQPTLRRGRSPNRSRAPNPHFSRGCVCRPAGQRIGTRNWRTSTAELALDRPTQVISLREQPTSRGGRGTVTTGEGEFSATVSASETPRQRKSRNASAELMRAPPHRFARPPSPSGWPPNRHRCSGDRHQLPVLSYRREGDFSARRAAFTARTTR